MTLQDRPSPEEEELNAKRAELGWLEMDFAAHDQKLAVQKAEHAAFEQLYRARLGTLNAELAAWKRRLANLPAERLGVPAEWLAEDPAPNPDRAIPSTIDDLVHEDEPSRELRDLYRTAARQLHPDLATGEEDRARRERSMKEVNAAYAAGDGAALRRIVSESEYSPDAVEGSGPGADLIRILRQLRQVRNRLAQIDIESGELARSDLGRLKARADIAAREGRDLLAEMECDIQNRLDGLKRRFGQREPAGSTGADPSSNPVTERVP